MGRVLGFYSLTAQPSSLMFTRTGDTLKRLHMCPEGQTLHEMHIHLNSNTLYFLASPLPSSSLPTS